MTPDITLQHPVIERTRLRFPELARQGWVYLTNTFWTPGQGGRPSEDELYARHGQPFEPRAVCIRPDLPAFGLAELAHVVLPGVAPVFIQPGRADLQAALRIGQASADAAWSATLDTYREFFTAVTCQQFEAMAQDGWLWVLDMRLRPGQQTPSPDDVERVQRHCLGLDYLQAQEVRLRPDMTRAAWPAGGIGSADLVPAFVRGPGAQLASQAHAHACACIG